MRENWVTRPGVILSVAVAVAVLWGSAYPGVKIGFSLWRIETGDFASKILFAGTRFFLAGVMTIAFASLRERRLIRPTRQELPVLAALGLILTSVQYFFYYIGLAHISASKGAILFSSGTFTAVLAAPLIVRGEQLTIRKVLGCLIGFVGVVVVNGSALGGEGITLLGEGFIVIAAVSFGLGSTWSKVVSTHSSPTIVTGYQMLIGGALLCLAGLLVGGRLTPVDPGALPLLLYLSFLSAAAFSLWTMLLKYNDVGKVTVYNFLVPIFGTLLSGIFLHEPVLTMRNLIALALVCTGIVVVNCHLSRTKRLYQ
ncbi:DMT family transporter [uncultured Dysosmobacter sp.]|uniref:DMT family transporter n=1 Tax=uncultured Dysosmobacter sp. TaxID=2591384 RepID=UPI0026394D4D|nr:DMT family transporter [uncultured Dysosmobacter sp.]